ncbi:MAG: hypothetical protein J7647_13080 [Cyanobacteria bacterium SBLK]|nr:hypothetical protein [Cyanobacteria bacterium SBLK]
MRSNCAVIFTSCFSSSWFQTTGSHSSPILAHLQDRIAKFLESQGFVTFLDGNAIASDILYSIFC